MWWTNPRKMTASVSLTVLALVLALLTRKPCCWLTALAMGVSTVGDGVLAGYPKLFTPVKNRLVKGGLIFLAAHFLYILALIMASGLEVPALLPRFLGPFAPFTKEYYST